MPARATMRPPSVILGIVGLMFAVIACAPPYPPPPETRVETVVDTLHGVAFADDYRWLEDQDSPETRAWIDAQNAYAEAVIGESVLRKAFRARLRELIDREDVGQTREIGEYEYFTLRPAGAEMERIHRRPAAPEGEEAEEPTVDGDYETVLDPVDFHPGHRVVLSMGPASPDDRFLMYSVRQGGADEVEHRILNLETLEELPDRLPEALYGGIDWDEDSGGFTYVHRDRFDGPRLKHHRLGTDTSEDEVLWGEGYGPETFIGRSETPDGRWRLYSVQHGWARNDWFLQDARTDGPLRPLVEGVQAHFEVRYREGHLYVLTDWNASNYRLMVADPATPDPAHWEELIPEGDAVLEGYTFIDDRIYASYLHEVGDRIRVFEMDGTPAGQVAVPPNASVQVSDGDDDGEIEVTASSYLRPSRTWEVDLASGARELTDSADLPFDTAGTVVTKTWYTSADGTRAPLHILHRADVQLDGSNPTILNGYGGFNVSITPGFSAVRAAWVEMGGIYAVATLRGGREFGEDWHRDGMLTNKPNVFADFIAAAEHLVAEGYTSPHHLGISGGSNGGLLVAAAMTARPELFRAVLCTYPDLDMVRFWDFQETNNMPALLEYGDARIPEHFEVMRTYSPYQQVRDGVAYPAVLLATGDLDTRVPPLQARKMAARLQAATSSGLPVILRYDEMGGHAAGRGRPMSMRIEETAAELAFMGRQLGLMMPEPVAAPGG
ncbi:MAG TPA: prolyl oligopeptidase family serine peptidase [Longimicrobiales bacterium]|nr:prolyl oligopeptidase family serine peptidase [Longimicrobiales bacterium]